MPEPRKSLQTVLHALKLHIEEAFKAIEAPQPGTYKENGAGWSVQTTGISNIDGKKAVLVVCTHVLASVDFSESRAGEWGYNLKKMDNHNTRWLVTRK
jgi:hypothetical protein